MALPTKNETDLTEFILPDQAASLLSKHIDIKNVCDDYNRIILDKIHRSTYLEKIVIQTLLVSFLKTL